MSEAHGYYRTYVRHAGSDGVGASDRRFAAPGVDADGAADGGGGRVVGVSGPPRCTTEDPDPGYMIITGFQRTTAEVAAAMNLSPWRPASSSRMPTLCRNDCRRWRRCLRWVNRLAHGAVDHHPHRVCRRLGDRTHGLALADRIAKWHCWSRKRIINAVDATVREVDPDAIRERVRREDRRHVGVTALGDGTARVDGIVAAEAGIAVDKRLTELAKGVCRDDPRTIDQRRADAMQAWSEGRTSGLPMWCRRLSQSIRRRRGSND